MQEAIKYYLTQTESRIDSHIKMSQRHGSPSIGLVEDSHLQTILKVSWRNVSVQLIALWSTKMMRMILRADKWHQLRTILVRENVLMSRISHNTNRIIAVILFQRDKIHTHNDSKSQTSRSNYQQILSSLGSIESIVVSLMSFQGKKALQQPEVVTTNLIKVQWCHISRASHHQEIGRVLIDANLTAFMIHQVMKGRWARCPWFKIL